MSVHATYLRRNTAQAAVDVTAWAIALTGVWLLRIDFRAREIEPAYLLVTIALAALIQLTVGYVTGVYRSRWWTGSFDESIALGITTATTAVVLALVVHFGVDYSQTHVPAKAVILAGFVALVVMEAGRVAGRTLTQRHRRPRTPGSRVLVFGAGEGGAQVVDAMLGDPNSPYLPVAFLDDDRGAANRRHRGVSVMGTRADMADVAQRVEADTLLIAIPTADRPLLADVAAQAESLGLKVLVLPPVAELFGGQVSIRQIRGLELEDLLGRNPIDTDLESIAGYLTGKRVLVTGAGGSIGSELCRQIHRFAPSELFMLDRNENALHAVQLSIEGRALLDTPNILLGNIRDAEAIDKLFQDTRPDVVFHAAALKHLPILERFPEEAFKTNVLGTLNVLHAASRVGVKRFVNVSTDKAADPTSVLGYTKRIAERLTARTATEASGTYQSVRFGNVLGSNGSVLHTFRAQVEAGGPITVTHPDVTRYFMTVSEAVQLVIQAGAIGSNGEALVLDMGTPVKIDDVARRLAAQAPRPIQIVYTGLREGEKCHEVLLGDAEHDHRPHHPLISHVDVPPTDEKSVDRFLDDVRTLHSPDEVIEAMVALTFEPAEVYES